MASVADVRRAPYSRRCPQFDADYLQLSLRHDDLACLYLGTELGGRPKSQALYRSGVVDYDALAATGEFGRGLERTIDGTREHRITLMGSEQNALECHRCLIIGRALSHYGVQVNHLLADGQVKMQPELKQELLRMTGRDKQDLLMSREERLVAAYRDRARTVARQRQVPSHL